MLELSLSENIILAVLSFFTALMTSIAGAGGGTVLLAAMLQFMNPAEAIPVHGVIQFTSNITRTWLLRKFVNWNIIFKFSLLLPIGIFIGLKIFQNIDGDKIKKFNLIFYITCIWNTEFKNYRQFKSSYKFIFNSWFFYRYFKHISRCNCSSFSCYCKTKHFRKKIYCGHFRLFWINR